MPYPLQMRRLTSEWRDIVAAGLDMRMSPDGLNIGNSTELIRLMPHPRNLLEWHFTFAGPDDSDFAGGLYHGKILLPADYPHTAPSIRVMTPNGR